jgi:hypothetical protein
MTKSASPIAFRTGRLIATAIGFPREGRAVQVTATGPRLSPAQPGHNREEL